MPLTALERHDLARSYGIEIRDVGCWPSHCQELLKPISWIMGMTMSRWEEYCESRNESWYKNTRNQAHELARLVEQLKKDDLGKKEADWRDIEPILFRHLNEDPACWTCNKRRWRAFYEVSPNALTFDTGLRTRQSNRQECNGKGADHRRDDPKFSRVFTASKERTVVYDKGLKRALKKKNERPDVLYGLAREGRVWKHMHCISNKKGHTRELKRSGSFKNRFTINTIFPFLICEAKSSSSADTADSIESQVSFAVREMLMVQKELADPDNTGKPAFEPFAWIVTYRGQTWNVMAARLEWVPATDGIAAQYSTDITHSWTGNMSGRDSALSLLLIIDYIADWARDIYRENVIASLEKFVNPTYVPMSRGKAPRTVKSLDMTNSPSTATSEGSNASTAPVILSEIEEHPHNLQNLYHEDFLFRDASAISFRVLGLVLTPENLSDISDPSKPQYTTHDLLGVIAMKFEKRQVAKMPGRHLALMEERWTGAPAMLLPSNYRNEQFLVVFTFSAYFSPHWEPVLEMSYIAISTRAYAEVRECRPPVAHQPSTNITVLDKERCVHMIKSFVLCPAYVSILACVSRCSVRPIYNKPRQSPSRTNIFDGNSALQSTWMTSDQTARYREFIWNLYRAHRLSSINPEETTYLRAFDKARKQEIWPEGARHNGVPWGFGELIIPSDFILLSDKEARHFNKCLLISDTVSLDDMSSDNLPKVSESYYVQLQYDTGRYSAASYWNGIDWDYNYRQVRQYEHKSIEALYKAYCEKSSVEEASFTTHLGKAFSKLQVDNNSSERSSKAAEDQSSSGEEDDSESGDRQEEHGDSAKGDNGEEESSNDTECSDTQSLNSSASSHCQGQAQIDTPPSSYHPSTRKKGFSFIRSSVINGNESCEDEDPLQSPSQRAKQSQVSRNTKSTLPRYLQILARKPRT